jgi:hypothetical protein
MTTTVPVYLDECLGWFSLGIPVSSTNKTDRHDITEILLKVALNTITPQVSDVGPDDTSIYSIKYSYSNFSTIYN